MHPVNRQAGEPKAATRGHHFEAEEYKTAQRRAERTRSDPTPTPYRYFRLLKLLDTPRTQANIPGFLSTYKTWIFPAFSVHTPRARIFLILFPLTKHGYSRPFSDSHFEIPGLLILTPKHLRHRR